MAALLTRAGAAALAIACGLCGAQAAAADVPRPVTLEALEAQDLNPGECGMFLWSRDNQEAFVLAAFDKPGMARIRTGGRTWSLPRTAFGGDSNSGHFEHQHYTNGDLSLDADIVFDETRPMADGAVVRDGIVRVSDRRGWETVMPVGGMVACKPEESLRRN